ncbi:MAG: archaeal ATPase, partial [Candidatus Nanosalina sp. J07AB43]
KRWDINSKSVLGIFDSAKFAIYEDLDQNREEIKQNDIVRAINGDTDALKNDKELPSAGELDDKVSPKDTYQVLDADSSQQEAIEAAKAGKSFVLQGPPGTGKSQTIANIVAEKLAKNEKVLFVSEKEAALKVVKNRLEDVGIGRFCLEVHGSKKSKSDVLSQIEEEMNNKPLKQVSQRDQELSELENIRQKLNQYGDLLFDDISDLGTPYEVQGRLAKLQAPCLNINFERPLEVEKNQFNRSVKLLEQLQDFNYEIRNYGDSPWKNIDIESWQINTEDQMKKSLEAQVDAIDKLKTWSQDQKADIKTLSDMNRYIEFLRHMSKKPDISTLETDLHEKGGKLQRAAELQEERRELEEEIESKYEDSVFREDGERILA